MVTSTLAGYVDLSLAEAEALSVAIGVPHLPWLVPPRPADPASDRVAVGRESLLARGLARRTDAGYQVDSNLAGAMRICARSGHVLSIYDVAVIEGRARLGMSWLCVGDDTSVSVSGHPDSGVVRIRSFPTPGTLHVMRRLTGGLDGMSPAPLSFSLTRAQLDRLRELLPAEGDRPIDPLTLDRAGIDTERVGEVLGDLSRAVVVTSLRGSAHGVTGQAFSWFVTEGQGLLQLRVSPDGSLDLAPVRGSDALQEMADVLALAVAR